MAKVTLDDLSTTLANSAAATLNANNTKLETALEKTLSRDGTGPNHMEADFDLNHNDILNVDNIHADVLVLNGQTVTPTDLAALPSTVMLKSTYDPSLKESPVMFVEDYDPQGKGADVYNSANIDFTQSGTGATERSVLDKLRDAVSVFDFGATGNGATDDTLAIRAAIATGKSVFFPRPPVYYNITDEVGPKFPGQHLFSLDRIRGMIRNTTNSNRLAVFGDVSVNSGAVPQAGMINLGFRGNAATLGGVWLPSQNSPGGNPSWTDASKDCQLNGVAIDNVGGGFAVQIHSWCNEVRNLTLYENNNKGIEIGIDANSNDFNGVYITDCDNVSIEITDVGTGRISRGNGFKNLVVQQSGREVTYNSCVLVKKATNTTFENVYFESNNSKGAVRSMYIDADATATVVTGVNHLSGGSVVISNDGQATMIMGVTSTGVTGNIVEAVTTSATGVILGVKVEVGFTSSGGLVGGAGFQNGLMVWLDDRTYMNDLTISNFAPSLTFIDRSGSSGDFRWGVDANSITLSYDSNSDGTFETTMMQLNPGASVPEVVIPHKVRTTQFYTLPDGVTAPTTVAGQAFLYVDIADGDLKIKFGDGVIKTIATDV